MRLWTIFPINNSATIPSFFSNRFGDEKNVLSLRFFKGKTQMEVADEIGISQAQVSRIEKGALNKIKSEI